MPGTCVGRTSCCKELLRASEPTGAPAVMPPPLVPAADAAADAAADTAAVSKAEGLIATEAATAALVWSSEVRAMSGCDA